MVEQFFDAFLRAAGLFVTFLAEKGHDEELSDAELEQVKGELSALTDIVDCELERRQAAYEDAGGADSNGDKNNAVKI